MSFEKALEFVFGVEAGLSDRASDRGGRTMMGITQKLFDAWRLSKGQARQDVALITREEATEIYQEWFWDAAGCALLPEPLALGAFDVAVNSGPHTAVKLMQTTLKLASDGVIGPATRAAFKSVAAPFEKLVMDYTDNRMDFYCDICKGDPTQVVNIKGWIRRARKLERIYTGG